MFECSQWDHIEVFCGRLSIYSDDDAEAHSFGTLDRT